MNLAGQFEEQARNDPHGAEAEVPAPPPLARPPSPCAVPPGPAVPAKGSAFCPVLRPAARRPAAATARPPETDLGAAPAVEVTAGGAAGGEMGVVRAWLEGLGLGRYAGRLEEEGWDCFQVARAAAFGWMMKRGREWTPDLNLVYT